MNSVDDIFALNEKLTRAKVDGIPFNEREIAMLENALFHLGQDETGSTHWDPQLVIKATPTNGSVPTWTMAMYPDPQQGRFGLAGVAPITTVLSYSSV